MSDSQTALEAALPHAVYLWPGQTHFGVGVAARAGSEAAALGATHVLLLADPGVLGLAQPIIDSLVGAGLTYTLLSEVAPNPSVESVDQAAAVYRAQGCDLIVALGGGSAIDTAKGVRMLAAAPGASIFDFSYLRAEPRPTPAAHALPPLIALPTTPRPATLTCHGHLVDEQSPTEPAKLTHNGDSAKLFLWDEETRRYREFDSISSAVFTERSDHLELAGVSNTLRREVGLKAEESRVVIEIRLKGCKTCG